MHRKYTTYLVYGQLNSHSPTGKGIRPCRETQAFAGKQLGANPLLAEFSR
jgi:hypothetical protein